MAEFNHTLGKGKWDHFMDQPFIGYTQWQFPGTVNDMGAIRLAQVPLSERPAWGWPWKDPVTPCRPSMCLTGSGIIWTFSIRDDSLCLHRLGQRPVDHPQPNRGTVGKDQRLWVSVDWSKAPKGTAAGTVSVAGVNTNFVVKVAASNPAEVTRDSLEGFVEGEGFVSIEPEHCTENTDAGAGRWIKIEDYGRTLSGMRAEGPVDAPETAPGRDSPCLEYRMYLFSAGDAEVMTIAAPTLNFVPGRGLRFALSFDDAPPQTVLLVPEKYNAQNGNRDWETRSRTTRV